MPYKFETEKKRIPRELNRNVKLSLEDREQIKREYGTISQRKLAKRWGVSRRLIVFIGDEEQYKKNLENRKGKSYYNKEKNTQYMRKHRQYKQKLNLKGELEKNGREQNTTRKAR